MERHVTCPIGLFDRAVPHILEKIFLCLDYNSYKKCLEVNSAWRELLTSTSYMKKSKDLFHQEIWEEETKLWHASIRGSVAKVRSLITPLVDVNCTRGNVEDTPLLLASTFGNKAVVQVLLDGGANPMTRNKVGAQPLHYAAKYGNKNVIKMLLEAGADPIPTDNYGNTPLHYAATRSSNDVVKVLLDGGADPNKKNNIGQTPLNAAIRGKVKENVRVLLDGGARR